MVSIQVDRNLQIKSELFKIRCELVYETLLRQRKLLPPCRKCVPATVSQRWLATE